MSTYDLLHNSDRCIGCLSCGVSCKPNKGLGVTVGNKHMGGQVLEMP